MPYQHFGITPAEGFSYGDYTESYCIYCGARYSGKFYDSPLGGNTLCSIHYKIYRKGKLTLPETRPDKPVYLDKNTELLFLNNKISK